MKNKPHEINKQLSKTDATAPNLLLKNPNKTEKTSILLDTAPQKRPKKQQSTTDPLKTKLSHVKEAAATTTVNPSGPKISTTKQNSNESTRDKAKDLIKQAIFDRIKKSDDKELRKKYINKEQLDTIVCPIEEVAFKEFLNTIKYNQKIKSIIFNIKDAKNKSFYKRILTLDPKDVIHMTHEEMNEELAEKEKQRQQAELEAIKKEQLKVAEDAKSHKLFKVTKQGLFVIGDDDYQTLTSVYANEDQVNANHAESEPTEPQPEFENPAQVEESEKNDQQPKEPLDTTENHKNHLFDEHCKICSGQIVEPPNISLAPIEPPKQIAKQLSRESNKSNHEDAPDIDLDLSMLNKIPSEPDILLAANSNSKRKFSTSNDFAFSPPQVSYGPSTLDYNPVTNDYATPNSEMAANEDVTLWKGEIFSGDINAKINLKATKLGVIGSNRSASSIDLPSTFEIKRTDKDKTWNYLKGITHTNIHDLVIAKFESQNKDENESSLQKLITNFKEKSRYGMTKRDGCVKTIFLVPIISNESIPSEFINLENEGNFKVDRSKTALIGILVISNKKSPEIDLPTPPDTTNEHKRKNSIDLTDDERIKRLRQQAPKDPRLNRQTSLTNDNDDIILIHEEKKEYSVEVWRNELIKSIEYLSKIPQNEQKDPFLNTSKLKGFLDHLLILKAEEQQALEKKHPNVLEVLRKFNAEKKAELESKSTKIVLNDNSATQKQQTKIDTQDEDWS